jgi:hypothetical protein
MGGINATDAAQVNAWGLGPPYSYTIEKIRFYAGDVAGDMGYSTINNRLNAGDASRILQYFVFSGSPPGPTPYSLRAPWTYWPMGETISSNPVSGSPVLQFPTLTVPAGSTTITRNFYAMCGGDFNATFVPGGSKSVNKHLELKQDGFITCTEDASYELPVRAGRTMDVSAASLILDYPSSQITITGVTINDGENTQALFNTIGDELRIGWNSVTPLQLAEGDLFMTIHISVNKFPGNSHSLRFELVPDDLNELADGMARAIPDGRLTIGEMRMVTGLQPTAEPSVLTFTCYPNPLKEQTRFGFTLPSEGNVTLEIRGMLGNIAKIPVHNALMTAGDHLLTMDASSLLPGVYTATLKVTTGNYVYCRTIKIVRTH